MPPICAVLESCRKKNSDAWEVVTYIGRFPSMYTPQEGPAVYVSVLASSVIFVVAGPCMLPPCVIQALGLRLHIPELFSDALFFGRYTSSKTKYPMYKSPDLCEECISLSNGKAFLQYSAIQHDIPSFQPRKGKNKGKRSFLW